MKSNKRKAAIIVMGILTLVLGAFAVVIGLRLQSSIAPSNTGALAASDGCNCSITGCGAGCWSWSCNNNCNHSSFRVYLFACPGQTANNTSCQSCNQNLVNTSPHKSGQMTVPQCGSSQLDIGYDLAPQGIISGACFGFSNSCGGGGDNGGGDNGGGGETCSCNPANLSDYCGNPQNSTTCGARVCGSNGAWHECQGQGWMPVSNPGTCSLSCPEVSTCGDGICQTGESCEDDRHTGTSTGSKTCTVADIAFGRYPTGAPIGSCTFSGATSCDQSAPPPTCGQRCYSGGAGSCADGLACSGNYETDAICILAECFVNGSGCTCSAQQTTCYQCTSSTTDGNTCTSQTVSGTTCPSGWTTNSNCAAAATGGSCPATSQCPADNVNAAVRYTIGSTTNNLSNSNTSPTSLSASASVTFACSNVAYGDRLEYMLYNNTDNTYVVTPTAYTTPYTINTSTLTTGKTYQFRCTGYASTSGCQEVQGYFRTGTTSLCPATTSPTAKLSSESTYVAVATRMAQLNTAIGNGSQTLPVNIDLFCGTGYRTCASGTAIGTAQNTCAGANDIRLTRTISQAGTINLNCVAGASEQCYNQTFNITTQTQTQTTCYQCTTSLGDGNTCTSQVVSGTTCPSGWSTNSNCASAAGGACPAQVTCYRCSASLTDGNTCQSSNFSGTSCPSGWGASSNCAATAGGACPVQVACAAACTSSSQCQTGYSCNAGTCKLNACITSPATCDGTGCEVLSACTGACDSHADCQNGYQCDPGTDTCKLPECIATPGGCDVSGCNPTGFADCSDACVDDNDCTAGLSCDDSVCKLDSCIANPALCDATACNVVACGDSCTTSDDCPQGGAHTCDGGTCKLTSCVSDPDTCDDTECAVVQCGDSCTTVADCPQDGNHTCSSGTCVLTSCSTNPETCDSTQCNPVQCGDACVNNSDCPQGGNHSCNDGVCTLNTCLTEGTCSDECTPLECGDGTVDPGEQCDDGNDDNGDGCSNVCTLESPEECGDGNVDAGEQCDDGNNNNNDSCSNTCQLTNIPATALISDDADRVLLAMATIAMGVALFKFGLIEKAQLMLGDSLSSKSRYERKVKKD